MAFQLFSLNPLLPISNLLLFSSLRPEGFIENENFTHWCSIAPRETSSCKRKVDLDYDSPLFSALGGGASVIGLHSPVPVALTGGKGADEQ